MSFIAQQLGMPDCPDCSSSEVALDVVADLAGNVVGWTVFCTNCASVGPFGIEPDDAVMSWNEIARKPNRKNFVPFADPFCSVWSD